MFTDLITSLTEHAAVSKEIIGAFKGRGWALYKVNTNELYSLEALKAFIEFGPEKDVLDLDTSYVPLPLVQEKDEKNGDLVVAAAQDCVKKGRMPRYAEFRYEEGKGIVPIGTGSIDSVRLTPGFLDIYLVMQLPHPGFPKAIVEIPLAIAATKVIYNVTKAYREVKNASYIQ